MIFDFRLVNIYTEIIMICSWRADTTRQFEFVKRRSISTVWKTKHQFLSIALSQFTIFRSSLVSVPSEGRDEVRFYHSFVDFMAKFLDFSSAFRIDRNDERVPLMLSRKHCRQHLIILQQPPIIMITIMMQLPSKQYVKHSLFL